MLTVRQYSDADWDAIWKILEPVFQVGTTYPFPQSITKQDAHTVWIASPDHSYVAVDELGEIVGSYYLKPNQPGAGAHVCNCGYVVAEPARGRGIASEMCKHSQQEAIRLGYRAMQYNLVVSTNEGAIRLWTKHGFEIAGRLPEAFKHPELGFVDALVMFKKLAN